MSIRAIDWAFKQNINHVDKIVLLALADYASDTGLAFPSTETISRKTNLSTRNVIRVLDRLVKGSLIQDTSQRVGRTKQIKVYCLKAADETALKTDCKSPFKTDNESFLKTDCKLRKTDSQSPVRLTPSQSEPSEEPSEEPAPCRPPNGGQQTEPDLIEDFQTAKFLICKLILKGKNPNRQWSYDAEANLARQLPIPKLEIERVAWFRMKPDDGSQELEMRKTTTETGLMAYWSDEVTRATAYWEKLYGWREKKKAAG